MLQMVGIKAHTWLATCVGWSLSLFSLFLLLNLNVASVSFYFPQIWRCWTKLKTFISRLAYISVLFAMLATFPFCHFFSPSPSYTAWILSALNSSVNLMLMNWILSSVAVFLYSFLSELFFFFITLFSQCL